MPTPPHIAALMLNFIDTNYCDLEDKFVADLGCGTGRLSIGSVLCGARMVVGFDIDRDALDLGLQNMIGFFGDLDDEDGVGDLSKAYSACGDINFVQADISQSTSDLDTLPFWAQFKNKFDTVIMNPPFGTKHNKGVDTLFLRTATEMAKHVVYSLHKTSTRAVSSCWRLSKCVDKYPSTTNILIPHLKQHIQGKCQQWDLKAKPVAQFRYNLDNTYKFHRRKSVDIDVDLWRIECD